LRVEALLSVEEAAAEVAKDVVVDSAAACPFALRLGSMLITFRLRGRLFDPVEGAPRVDTNELGHFAVVDDVHGRVHHSGEHCAEGV